MEGHPRRVTHLQPGVAEGAGSFDDSDGTVRDELLRQRPDPPPPPPPRQGRTSKAEAAEADLHEESHRASLEEPSSLRQALEAVFQAQHPDLSGDQVAHAIDRLLPLCSDAYLKGPGLAVAVSVLASYERDLANGVTADAPTVDDLEATRRLSEYLEREVQDCRTELFGSQKAPFPTIADASAWAEREASSHALTTGEYHMMALALEACSPALRVAAEAREVVLLAAPAQPTQAAEGKPAAHVIEPFWLFLVGRSERLALLADTAERLAEEVGVGADAVVRAILLGQPAAVRAWQVAHLPRAGVPFRAAVEIRDPQLSYQEVRQVFGALTRRGILTPSTSSAEQRAKLERVYDFVVERRFASHSPLTWTDVALEWNEAHPKEHYDVRSIKRAFDAVLGLRGEEKPPVVRGRRRKLQPKE